MSEVDLLAKIEQEISKRNISEDKIAEILKDLPQFTNRRIIGGYCSCAIKDREGQLIPVYALKPAVKHFMEDNHYRLLNIFHSDICIGRLLPKWTNPETGVTYETRVDDTGWYCIAEVRDDLEVANKVWEEIEKGNLRSFSIAGTSQAKKEMYERGQSWEEVMKLQIAEVTVCEIPVNSLSTFSMLWSSNKVDI